MLEWAGPKACVWTPRHRDCEQGSGQVRSLSCDIIRGTVSSLFKEIVFSATGLASIDWNGNTSPNVTFDIA